MKKITIKKDGRIIAEGIAEDGNDTVEALKTAAKTFEGVPGITFEVIDGTTDEVIREIRDKMSRPYQVSGTVKIGSLTGITTVEILAVSVDEALKKAEAEGLIDPYIDHRCEDYDDDYDDDYDEDDEDEGPDEDVCYECSGHNCNCPYYTGDGLCDYKFE